jgi:hypothetical protein
MRILTIILFALLLTCIGGAAFFYVSIYQPIAAENERIKSGIPELDKAKADLKKYKESDAKETAWTNAVLSTLNAGLSDEIKSGKAEVLSAGDKVIVNISAKSLYLLDSKTFSKESPQLLLKLESLLRSEQFKGKDIYIGNTVQPPAANMKGKRKTPAKDARALAADRSIELIKYLVKKGLNQNMLIAVAYASKQPEVGFKFNANKTIIIITNPLALPMAATVQEVPAKPTPITKGSVTTSAVTTTSPASQLQSKPLSTKPSSSPASSAPKPIPIRPAQTKPN